MSNPIFKDGRIKIGQSKNDPSSFRKDELYQTGVPEPFKVEYIAFVENFIEIERKIHRVFSQKRPNKDREFFNVSVSQAILAIRENSKIKFEEVFYKSSREIEDEKNKIEDEKNKIKNQRRLEEQRINNQKKIDEIKKNKEVEYDQLIKNINKQRESYVKEEKKISKNLKYVFANNFSYILFTLTLGIIVSGTNYIEIKGYQIPLLWILLIFIYYFFYKKEKSLEQKYLLIAEQKFPYPLL